MRKLLLYAALLLLTQCSKCKDDAPSPLEQLPPATQTGANTFGCLVNGQAWTPKGYTGSSNNSVSYDPGLNGGVMDIQTYRYPEPENNDFQYIYLFANQLSRPGEYYFTNQAQTRASFRDTKTRCYWNSRDTTTTYRRGTLKITRLDLTAGIISGTFEFTLAKPGCDTIRVTNGRFDYQL